MRAIARFLGPALCVVSLVACGAGSYDRTSKNSGEPTGCQKGGEQCRWDGQCCSGRCYVDTGCSG